MDDRNLTNVAVTFSDDLYKTAASIGVWGGMLPDYLGSSAGTFTRVLSERGIRIQYLVDNAWPDMTRPLSLLPEWYSACGFAYCCAQNFAHGLAVAEGIPEPEISETWPRYEAEARLMANKFVELAHERRNHVFQLDADMQKDSFDAAFSCIDEPGVLTILREAAPEPGSNVNVWFHKTNQGQ